jgi:predicted O-methyltransferase YrrM
MDLADDHKQRKLESYWSNLVEGANGIYKAAVIDRLIQDHFEGTAEAMLDIGVGTSAIALEHRKKLEAPRLVCADYDAKVVEESKQAFGDGTIEWRVADIFDIDQWTERFDLVFLLDMIHEVYSFYGRPNRDTDEPIDHDLGIKRSVEAISKVASLVKVGGGIIISDNILTEERGPVRVRVKNENTREAVEYFFENYRSRRMRPTWSGATFELPSRDFCILLTQYNKIKQQKWDRWNVERLEVHQYMSESEYRQMFEDLGFRMHIEIGTPEDARQEWDGDFEVVAGRDGLPPKRVTLIAIREKA